jgi:uncharacterized protein
VQPFAVVETHVSLLVFLPEHVLKLKKPLTTPFLDQGTVEQRRHGCELEVALNRRICPDVYLGVVPVAVPGMEPVDHAVLMRRLPAERRLARLARHGEGLAEVRAVARVVAAFHANARRGPDVNALADPEAVRGLWTSNFAELTPLSPWLLAEQDLAVTEGLALRYVAGRTELLEERVRQGRAVDGHGDLLADDIFCLPDGPRILDCLEFAERFRFGDVLLDVAMLAMDLERLGRPDMASELLRAYREFSGETHPPSLEHHYVGYRALVRCKVAALRSQQGDEAAADEARRLLAQCRRHLEAGAIRLVLVGGLPGTGKSTVAEGLGERLSATVLRSDVIRKELAGLDALTPAGAPVGAGIYDAASTEATYAELLRRAEVALRRGEVVVLDATWSSHRHREAAAALARNTAADLVELRCEAPRETVVARLAARRLGGGDASDADEEVARAMAATFDAWPSSTVITTAAAPPQVLAAALQHVTG